MKTWMIAGCLSLLTLMGCDTQVKVESDGENSAVWVGQKEEKAAQPTEKYYLALDLKDDAALIAEYKKYHEKIWPEITQSIHDAGIIDMEIYNVGNRMVMVVEVPQGFDWDARMGEMGAKAKNKEWEEVMWKFQQPLPGSAPGEKWRKMERIYKLEPKAAPTSDSTAK